MKTLKLIILLAFTLTSVSRAEEARFFRIAGPVATAITAFSADGDVTWTNAATNATFTVQAASALLNPINWVDYIQVPATNPVTTHRLYDLIPPAGMAFIPAGSFTMGDTFSEGGIEELPLHTVYVSAFYMDRYEVTKALWDDVYNWAITNGYSFDNAGSGKAANHPVQTINWYDAAKWCNARSEQAGRTPVYYIDATQSSVYRSGEIDITNECVNWAANGYRLPTEAEWEKAARGGLNGRRFPWGNTISWSQANYYAHPTFKDGVDPYTSPVGYFAANGYGLYDMAGNVFEWCWDYNHASWYGNGGATQNDTRGPTGPLSLRVFRGGSWSFDSFYSRCALRYYYYAITADHALDFIGFRCVRGL